MANLLIIVVLALAFLRNYLQREIGELPSQFKYSLDGLIGIAAVFVVAKLLVSHRWTKIPIVYFFLFICFCYAVIAGAFINSISPDVLFAGFRTYFKYVIVFLIPIAFIYTARDREVQIKVLLFLVAIQGPVTLWQRVFDSQTSRMVTGDYIFGTMTTTSSIAIACSITIIMALAFCLAKKLSIRAFIGICLLMLVPAGLSETKAVPIFLVAGAAILCFAQRHLINSKQIVAASIGLFLFLTSFVAVYDLFYTRAGGEGFLAVITDKERMVDNYNFKGLEAKSLKFRERSSIVVGESEVPLDAIPYGTEVGRLDTIFMPFDVLLPHEVSRLVFGVGIGNIDSRFGSGGDFRVLKERFGATTTTLSMLTWETGLLGVLAYLFLIACIAKDALVLARREFEQQTFAAGVLAVCAITVLSLVYANLFHLPEISVLLAYMCGLIVSDRISLQKDIQQVAHQRVVFYEPIRKTVGS